MERVAEARLPTRYGEFLAVGYRSTVDAVEHIALVRGEIGTGTGVLVRLHSECLTGDVLGSLRCDCGPQLDAALRTVADGGPRRRGLPARPRGPGHRAAAQAARPTGCRTAAATPSTPTSTSGCPPTRATSASARRSSATSASRSVRLLTNNPAKRAGVEEHGLTVLEQVPLEVHVTPENIGYLRTKRDRMGHDLPGLDGSRADPTGSADMSGAGSPDLEVDGSGLRVAVVAAQWHQVVMDGLVAGALRGLAECGVEEPLLRAGARVVRAAGGGGPAGPVRLRRRGGARAW